MKQHQLMEVLLPPGKALEYMRAVDKSAQPWQLQATDPEGSSMTFELWVDGYCDPLTITMESNGTWSCKTHIPIWSIQNVKS